jgi:hypothetical protein
VVASRLLPKLLKWPFMMVRRQVMDFEALAPASISHSALW